MSSDIHALYRASGSLAFMSFCGALFVVFTFITIKELRKHPTRLIFFLSVCDVMFSLKFLVTSFLPHSVSLQDHTVACLLQAGAQQFFGLASISWNGMISLNLIINTTRPFENSSSYNKLYHIWVWGLSAVTSIIMFAARSTGPSGDGTCWVEGQRSPIRLLFFVPLLIYFAISISSLIIAAIYSRNSGSSSNSLSERNRTGMLLRMASYTLVFILCWTGPLIHRIVQFTGKVDRLDDPNFLMYLDAFSVSIQGFVNSMIWLTNPSILKGFFYNIKKYLPWSDKYINQGENTPLIRSLQDEMQDPIQLAVILRNNILTCCLRGITLSVEDNLLFKLYSGGYGPINSTHMGGVGNGSGNTFAPRHNSNNGGSGSFNKISSIPPDVEERVYSEKELFNIDSLQSVSGTPSTAFLGRHEFKDYCPATFARIRALKGIAPEEYLKSFDSSLFFENLSNQKFSEGKSGSFMCFTPDSKYLIKTITRQECVLLKKKISKFYDYLFNNPSSFLLRFYGCYKITMPNDHCVYLAVMSNVFSSIPAGIKVKERYDLKGSTVNRGGNDINFNGTGLGLDNDFLNFRKQLSVPTQHKQFIVDQLKKDAEFMSTLNIMDYSLLIGIIPNDELFKEKNTLDLNQYIDRSDFSNGIVSGDDKFIYYVGVIDILQLYDFNKKLERFLKINFVRKAADGISAIPTEPYKQRFVKRMNQIIQDTIPEEDYDFSSFVRSPSNTSISSSDQKQNV
ncbi:hypothetical protein CYY_009606 [Polysphondylium violaceum]|uniref:G-protein-coupled receptor family protein n=1 Tax=Polysphondylium violaceum TaxID=133409 RepID=A0A8J4PLE7_9MYCE|nr:hypothetical protein CYY_009606 [Polysphondylium violaceum]